MKNFLYSAFMLAVVILTACSNDDNGETQPKRGLTLNASVENLSSRATMTDEKGTWKFAFAENDQVSVSNNQISSYYTFTNGGYNSPVLMPRLPLRLPTGMLTSQVMKWT